MNNGFVVHGHHLQKQHGQYILQGVKQAPKQVRNLGKQKEDYLSEGSL